MQKGQKNYLVFNVTEHVHLYCNISVLNLCVFAVYIFYRKTWFFGVIFFCHIFSGKNFLQFICTMFIIKHRMFLYTLFVSFSSKMEYAILLSTSLGHGVMKPMEPVFLSLHLHCLGSHSKCKCKMQAMTVCSHLRLHLDLNVLMLFTHVFSWSCICVWTRLNFRAIIKKFFIHQAHKCLV